VVASILTGVYMFVLLSQQNLVCTIALWPVWSHRRWLYF